MKVYPNQHARQIAGHADPSDRVRRLESLLTTLSERHGPGHPLARRVADQLARARQDAVIVGEAPR